MSTPGKIYEYNQGAYITAKLYNFDVGKFDIKMEHSNWLISAVAPKLRSGGSLTIVGLASRTGTDSMNMKLSENRSRAVIDLLRRIVPNNFKVAVEMATGERAALFAGVKDGVEQQSWRAVVISAWDKPTPPPPPPPPPPKPQPQAARRDETFDTRWIGIGIKSGGQLGIGGYESTKAYLVNLGDFETFDLTISSGRWGLGLGGSSGAVAVLGFGFRVPNALQGKSLDDWGVNVAVTKKLIGKSVITWLESSKYLIDGFKHNIYKAPKLGKAFAGAALLQNTRNALHTVYAGHEATKPYGVVVIDLPAADVGLELSAFLTRGTMYVSNPSQWIEPS